MKKVLIACAIAFFAAGLPPAQAELRVTDLKCEYRTNPLGIDTAEPRLSWVLESNERGQRQTAYRIMVSSSAGKLRRDQADLWDTGKVQSDRSLHVSYDGEPLESCQRCWWKVRVWGRDGEPSDWSAPARWETALLDQDDWKAQWITDGKSNPTEPEGFYKDDPAPLFRKELTVNGQIRRARLYISGLGHYEASLNGDRVGDDLLAPGWTAYSERVLYNTYDVTSQLREGENCLGVMLGDGWFNPVPMKLWGWLNLREYLTVGRPRLKAQLLIEYADGSRETIATDESWKVAPGPIVRNDPYLGEVYDARRERPDWNTPGYDGSGWDSAGVAREELGPLSAQSCPPVRATKTLQPVKIMEPEPDTYIFDFGQNLAGRVRLRVRGKRGTRIRMRYGELLYDDGTLNPMTSAAGQVKRKGVGGPGAPDVAAQTDIYIVKGDGEETYAPRFCFRGFRYVEVTGFPGEPDLDNLTAQRLNSDVTPVGKFACSNELFNRIHRMVRWTFLSNMFTVQSDCPHREKFQYGGDIVCSLDAFALNLDMASFYGKSLRDFADDIRSNHGVTETAPYVGIKTQGLGGGSGPIGWSTAYPMLAWKLRQYYGNRRALTAHYDRLKRYVDFVIEKAGEDNIIARGIGDHESLDKKPTKLTSTAFYYYNVNLLARMAGVLGKDSDAEKYSAKAEEIEATFNETFLDEGTGRYGQGTQACQAFALHHDLVPPEKREEALKVLLQEIKKHDGHLRTGIFGTRYMLLTLSEMGRTDAAQTVVSQRSFPGWGYMLDHGATTLWEHWAFSDNTFSHNHPMFGSVSEWFYRYLAGIRPAPDAVGFDRVVIDPRPVDDLEWVQAEYRSMRGPIVSRWRKRESGGFRMKVSIPPNVTARICVPAKDIDAVKEGNQKATGATGLEVVGMRDGRAVFEADSGEYNFLSRLPSE